MTATSATFAREWSELWGRPISLVIKLVYPVAIAVPLLWAPVPPFLAATALTILIATVGGVGTAAVLARERSMGLQHRFVLAPRAAGRTVVDRVAAAASVDVAQTLPLLVLVGIRHPGGAIWWPGLLCALVGMLLMVDALGAFASSLASSPGEVMLCVMLPLLPAFFLSGVFVAPFGALIPISHLLPFTYFHAALQGALGGAAPVSPLGCILGGIAFGLIGVGAAYLTGRRVLEAA
ncbi:MAG: ABC transporter permease [Candidatus Dormibacteraeota bacterium]|nr:ABC transporter permease [Candidatus Dormibacteraeota bacterium]